MKEILIKDKHVEIVSGNITDIIPKDNTNDDYIDIKTKTNNFTESLKVLNEKEEASLYNLDLDFRISLLEMGADVNDI